MDIALEKTATGEYDIVLDGADLRADNGLNTAVVLSLLADARADADDEFDGDDPRGYWGDSVSEIDNDSTGSKLWLLGWSKTVPDVLRQSESYAQAALAWLVDDGIASQVQSSAVRVGRALSLDVAIQRPAGNTPFEARYQYVWEQT